MWENLFARLNGLHCIAIDMPGHGKSRSIPWISMQDTADRVAMVVAGQARNGTAHIVGLSLGAYVGLTLMSRHGDLLGRCMLSGLNVLPLPHPRLMGAMACAMAPLLKTSFGANMNARALGIPVDQRQGYRQSLKEFSMRSFIAANRDASTFSQPQALDRVHHPTLLIAGENEHPLIHRSMAVLKKTLPNAQARWARGCGHGWSGEKPELFAATALAWCQGQPLPPQLMTELALKSG
jgi:pimeloyl-ACP methyl ester carboxylesterase